MPEKTYKKNLTIWIIVTVILVGVSFFAGSAHGKSSAQSAMAAARSQFGGGAGRTGTSRFGAGGGAVMGSVIAEDATSITVKSKDGSSKIVLFSGSTPILKTAAGSASDVTVGTTVSVQGTQNSDGSVTAQSIQIRPTMPAGTTGGAPTPTPAAQ